MAETRIPIGYEEKFRDYVGKFIKNDPEDALMQLRSTAYNLNLMPSDTPNLKEMFTKLSALEFSFNSFPSEVRNNGESEVLYVKAEDFLNDNILAQYQTFPEIIVGIPDQLKPIYNVYKQSYSSLPVDKLKEEYDNLISKLNLSTNEDLAVDEADLTMVKAAQYILEKKHNLDCDILDDITNKNILELNNQFTNKSLNLSEIQKTVDHRQARLDAILAAGGWSSDDDSVSISSIEDGNPAKHSENDKKQYLKFNNASAEESMSPSVTPANHSKSRGKTI